MLKIAKTKEGYRISIITEIHDKIDYYMTEQEYMNLVLKGWEDYVKMYCKYAKKICQYEKKIHTYVEKFCGFTETVCKNFTFTATGKKTNGKEKRRPIQ